MVPSLSRAAFARIAPFLLFLMLLFLRGVMGAEGPVDPRWIYGVSVLAVAAVLLWFRNEYGELGWQNLPTRRELMLAVLVGLILFVLWISLDAPMLQLPDAAATFTPVDAQGERLWPLIAVRWAGAALLVPVMEELFWRSFLMRWIDRAQFETVPPQRVSAKAVILSTFVFTLAHTMWLAAALAGLAYAWLFIRTGRLWVPVIAHAVTNGALGAWVVATGHWSFW